MEVLSYLDEKFIGNTLAFCLGSLIGFLIFCIARFISKSDHDMKIWRIKRYKEYTKGILLSDGQFVEYDDLIDTKIDQKIEGIIKDDGYINFKLDEFLKDHGALYIDSREIICNKKVIMTEDQQKYFARNMQFFNKEQKKGISNLQRECILYRHVENLMFDKEEEKDGKRKK